MKNYEKRRGSVQKTEEKFEKKLKTEIAKFAPSMVWSGSYCFQHLPLRRFLASLLPEAMLLELLLDPRRHELSHRPLVVGEGGFEIPQHRRSPRGCSSFESLLVASSFSPSSFSSVFFFGGRN